MKTDVEPVESATALGHPLVRSRRLEPRPFEPTAIPVIGLELCFVECTCTRPRRSGIRRKQVDHVA